MRVQSTVYTHLETTNQSFIDMHYLLKAKGVDNNKFFLVLYDEGLKTIDPRDPNLPLQWQQRVLHECMINFWYFIREIIRIPAEGGTVGGGVRYKLHRGNLAMNFLFILNYNMFIELPRQHGKTMSAMCWYLWVFNFGSTNTQMIFMHKNHQGSKDNLERLKRLRENLPSYLRMDSALAIDGKKLKAKNTVEVLEHPNNGNKIRTLASARNKASANNLGRGATVPIHYYDEFAFMQYNKIIYGAATPAYKTASANAKKNGAPYGILITTTPGDLTTDEGVYAYDIRNAATPWNDKYYDLNYQQLEELRQSNTNSNFFHVMYSYQQLGSGEDYFKEMVIDLQKDWANIRREVLLEWSKASDNCPFQQEDLDIIEQFCREPIREIFFGRAQQYTMLIYRDFDPRYPPIIGVDVSGSMYQDSSAITIIDSKTTEVIATFNCNYIPSDDLAEVVYTLVKQYMPNAIVNVEANGGFGASVLQRLVKTDIKNNLYYEIKDKVLEERSNGTQVIRKGVKVKSYGLHTNHNIRNRLIELLYERVNYHKDKFISKVILDEMQQMEVKKNGKVEHSNNSHDDQVFSYLMALYVWYDGQDIAQKFGIQKCAIKTDEDLDEVIVSLEDKYDGLIEIDLNSIHDLDQEETPEQKQTHQFFASSATQMQMSDFNDQQKAIDDEALSRLFEMCPDAKKEYARKYHINLNEISIGSINDVNTAGAGPKKNISDEFLASFYDDGDEEQGYSIYQGNLSKEFQKL